MMKTSICFLAGILLCGSVGGAAAATDREVFEKKVRKVAPLASEKGKTLCYCVNQTSATFQNRVGFIRHAISNNQVFVNCQGDVFDAAGTDVGSFACTEFRPLVK
jgi:hypothetical protein